MLLVLEKSDHTPKYWRDITINIMFSRNQKLEDHQSNHGSPWGEHGCVYQISWQSLEQFLDISFKATNVKNTD